MDWVQYTNAHIKIMIAFADDKTAVEQFGTTTLNYSLSPNSYLGSENTMITESSPYVAKGILGTDVNYWHSITLQKSTLAALSGDVFWLRAQTTDNINPAIYIPEPNSSFLIKKYCTIRFK